MAWLHDNGDENEYPQLEEDEGGEKEGLLEETEEEITVTERPGAPAAPPASRPKPAKKPRAKSRRKPAARAKARSRKKKKAAGKRRSRGARKRGKSRSSRRKR